MTVQSKNYSNQADPVKPPGETEFRNCNFSMTEPVKVGNNYEGHPLSWGSGLTFIECNFVNREPPAGCTLTGCNTTIRQSCQEVDVDKVKVGSTWYEMKKYAHILYGRYNTTTSEYDYHTTPVEIECKAPE